MKREERARISDATLTSTCLQISSTLFPTERSLLPSPYWSHPLTSQAQHTSLHQPTISLRVHTAAILPRSSTSWRVTRECSSLDLSGIKRQLNRSFFFDASKSSLFGSFASRGRDPDRSVLHSLRRVNFRPNPRSIPSIASR